jgi:DNA-binding Lrp family transcriptional regulator
MADITEEALKVIQSHPEGVTQSDLWKLLEIDSRKCSRVVKRLTDEGLVDRIEVRHDGVKTYLLKATRRTINPALLMARDELAPCVGCEEDCIVESCPYLMDWMYLLALEEFES